MPRGLTSATLALIVLAWTLVGLGLDTQTSACVQSVVYLSLFALTVVRPAWKVTVVRQVQRTLINPLVRILFALGLNPLGLVVLETRGRISGLPRRTPVGNGRTGTDFWIIAEHGLLAGYVRNISHHSAVRLRMRVGWRYRWVDGIATVRIDDDPIARQRRIAAWHPLRALNAVNVRAMGSELVSVHVALASGARAGLTAAA